MVIITRRKSKGDHVIGDIKRSIKAQNGIWYHCNGDTILCADFLDYEDFLISEFADNKYFGGNGTTTIGLPDYTSQDVGDLKHYILVKL